MTCPACGAENRSGRRFCPRCGTALEVACSSCGATNEPDDRFCGSCGSPLVAEKPTGPAEPPPTSERRLVSVLFADLVGFTALSEHRDPEDVRALLSRYFERCRTLIERYGGTGGKVIGGAGVGGWGGPGARGGGPQGAGRGGPGPT